MQKFSHIRGILFDLDGVLYIGNQVIDGARETIQKIRQRGFICRFITNTSTLSRHSLQQKLTHLGFDISESEILSAPQATLVYLQQFNDPVCRLLLADDVKQDFQHLKQSDQQTDFIIIGDIGEKWSYSLLNSAFNQLMDGAKLIAIHKNRYWQTETGLKMDIGGFVTALEYASDQQAMLIGKPATAFFHAALHDMKLAPEQVVIIGDDIESDIGGGKKAGISGILVKTGKYRAPAVKKSKIKSDLIIPSIANLPDHLPLKAGEDI